jgi:RES domain
VFRSTALVDRVDVERRGLLTAVRSGPGLRLADLRAAGARSFGVTADLAGGDDYTVTHLWAAALLATGVAGIRATVRHDPTHRARDVVVFGPAGARSRVRGWRSSLAPLLTDAALMSELARARFRVLVPGGARSVEG